MTSQRVPRPTSHVPPAVALLVLLGFTCLLWQGGSRPWVSQEVAPIPGELGPWKGQALQVAQRTVEILETDDVALMEYRLGADTPVWFAQVAGFGNRAAFHPPELCYVGSHFEVLERGPITVLVHGRPRRLMRLVVGQGGQQFESWYWFTANDRVTPNYYQQQLWLVLDAVRRRPMSGTLVRISTALDDSVASHRRLLAFLTSFDATRNPPQGVPSANVL